MNNTIQLYVDEEKQVKGFPLTSPDRVIDSNGKSIKEKLKNNVKFDVVGGGPNIPPIDGRYDVTEIKNQIKNINTKLDKIVDDKDSTFYNLNNFKKSESDIDDTERIQKAIDYCSQHNLTLIIPNGEFIVSEHGKKNLSFLNGERGYCIYKENVKLNVIQLGTIKLYLDNATSRPNIFTFKNSEINWYGGIFKGVNNTTKKILYGGNPIVLDTCYNSHIKGVKSYDTNGGPLLMLCNNSLIDTCYFENSSKLMSQCGTAFGIYAGKQNTITDCVSFGGTGDGDISLYGSGEKNRVINSKCFNSLNDFVIATTNTGAQGICVDAGQDNSSVINSYAFGYYYGIDIKTNISNCLVMGNVVERCKVGITLRYGEAGGHNVFATIQSNIILNPWNGNSNKILDEAYWCGIMIDSSNAVDIKDNVIKADYNYELSKHGIGVLVTCGINSTQAYLKNINIDGNNFSDQCGLASSVKYIDMTDIYLDLVHKQQRVNIINNVFTGAYGSKVNSPFIKVVNSLSLNISNNIFGRIDRPDGAIMINNTDSLLITNNQFGLCKGLFIFNNVSTFTMIGNLIHGCVDWKDVLSGSIVDVCVINSNIYKAESGNTGTFCKLSGGKKILCSNNILYMNRASRNEFVLNGTTENVVENNNFIEHK